MAPSVAALGFLTKYQNQVNFNLYPPRTARNHFDEAQRHEIANEIAEIQLRDTERARLSNNLDLMQDVHQLIRSLEVRLAYSNGQLEARPTVQSQQDLQIQVAELERRPTIQSQLDLRAQVAELERRPTVQSYQELEARVAELEQRPTVQSQQDLQKRLDELKSRPTSASYQQLQSRNQQLIARPTPEAYQNIQAQVSQLQLRPTTDEHQTVQRRLVELEEIHSYDIQDTLMRYEESMADMDAVHTADATAYTSRLAVEIALRESAEQEVSNMYDVIAALKAEARLQAQHRAQEEDDFVAEVESHKVTATERDSLQHQLHASQHSSVSLRQELYRMCSKRLRERRKFKAELKRVSTTFRRWRQTATVQSSRQLQLAAAEKQSLCDALSRTEASSSVLQSLLSRSRRRAVKQTRVYAQVQDRVRAKFKQTSETAKDLHMQLQLAVAEKENLRETCSHTEASNSVLRSLLSRSRGSRGQILKQTRAKLQQSKTEAHLVAVRAQLLVANRDILELRRQAIDAKASHTAMSVLFKAACAKLDRQNQRSSSLVLETHSKVERLQDVVKGCNEKQSRTSEDLHYAEQTVAELCDQIYDVELSGSALGVLFNAACARSARQALRHRVLISKARSKICKLESDIETSSQHLAERNDQLREASETRILLESQINDLRVNQVKFEDNIASLQLTSTRLEQEKVELDKSTNIDMRALVESRNKILAYFYHLIKATGVESSEDSFNSDFMAGAEGLAIATESRIESFATIVESAIGLMAQRRLEMQKLAARKALQSQIDARKQDKQDVKQAMQALADANERLRMERSQHQEEMKMLTKSTCDKYGSLEASVSMTFKPLSTTLEACKEKLEGTKSAYKTLLHYTKETAQRSTSS